jgi:adenylosuccinate synthase
MLNGVTQLIMTKADVLSAFDEIKVCTHYKYKGETIDYFPYDVINNDVEPIWKSMKAWDKDLTNVTSIDDLPQELMDYVTYLEQELQVPIKIISVGPRRSQTLLRD